MGPILLGTPQDIAHDKVAFGAWYHVFAFLNYLYVFLILMNLYHVSHLFRNNFEAPLHY